MMDFRFFFASLFSAVLGFLSPITDFMMAAAMLFVVNFLFGLLAASVGHEGWQWKKAFTFFWHCFIFFGLITFIFMCGHFMHNREGAIQCVSVVCYAAIYMYGVNILRNLLIVVKKDTPLHKLLDYGYYVLTLKFCQKLPYWKEYVSSGTRNHGEIDATKPRGGQGHG